MGPGEKRKPRSCRGFLPPGQSSLRHSVAPVLRPWPSLQRRGQDATPAVRLSVRKIRYSLYDFSYAAAPRSGAQTQPVGLGSAPHLQISFMGPFLKTS